MALGDAALVWMLVPNCSPLLSLGSRGRRLWLANLGGNAEVWLPRVIELPVLQYPYLEISPDLGAEFGEGTSNTFSVGVFGLMEIWEVVAHKRVVFGLVGWTGRDL